MGSYVTNRVLQTLPLFIISSILVFLMLYILPGDPALVLAGPDALPGMVQAIRAHMGLDKPLPVQYFIWLGHLFHGDLGKSFINGMEVKSLLWLKGLATTELTIGAFFIAVIISFPLGLISAAKRGTWIDTMSQVYSSLALAIPTFWLGILLVLLFGVRFGWLPTSGYIPFMEDPGRSIKFLIMPSVTLGIYIGGSQVKFIRAAVIDVMDQDYIRTARAKGLRERTVFLVHCLRNALISVITILGIQLGTFLGGAVVTEALFAWPGIGRLLMNAIEQRDYAVVQGVVLVVLIGFLIINLLVDLTYAILDPRIRYNNK
jgi:peptide/nickel transport system permease protein